MLELLDDVPVPEQQPSTAPLPTLSSATEPIQDPQLTTQDQPSAILSKIQNDAILAIRNRRPPDRMAPYMEHGMGHTTLKDWSSVIKTMKTRLYCVSPVISCVHIYRPLGIISI